MSERKAINKYYPPDWDPAQAPKKKKSTNPNVNKVRLMVPFSMKCLQCTEYIANRRKFNARKEITNEKYMGIKLIRFHIKCPRCNHNLVFQTDPKSAGFIPVSGVQRNYESLATQEAVKPEETEEEMLQRLEKQDKEDQEFKDQQYHRKRNPLWQLKDTTKPTMASLEEKILEHQKVQETHDHLKFLEAKARKLNDFGEDQAVEQARNILRQSIKRADFSQDEKDTARKAQKLATATPSSEHTTSPPLKTVPAVISLNVEKLKQKQLSRAGLKDENASRNKEKLTRANHLQDPARVPTSTSIPVITADEKGKPVSNVFNDYNSCSEEEE